MSSNSVIILENQPHQGDSNTQTVTSEKFKGDGFYGRSDGLHTIQTDLNGFVGKIEFQASLATDPEDEDWFTVQLGTGTQTIDTTGLIAEENITYIEYTESTTDAKVYNFTGNYVWIRTIVTNWTDGTINAIRLNH